MKDSIEKDLKQILEKNNPMIKSAIGRELNYSQLTKLIEELNAPIKGLNLDLKAIKKISKDYVKTLEELEQLKSKYIYEGVFNLKEEKFINDTLAGRLKNNQHQLNEADLGNLKVADINKLIEGLTLPFYPRHGLEFNINDNLNKITNKEYLNAINSLTNLADKDRYPYSQEYTLKQTQFIDEALTERYKKNQDQIDKGINGKLSEDDLRLLIEELGKAITLRSTVSFDVKSNIKELEKNQLSYVKALSSLNRILFIKSKYGDIVSEIDPKDIYEVDKLDIEKLKEYEKKLVSMIEMKGSKINDKNYQQTVSEGVLPEDLIKEITKHSRLLNIIQKQIAKISPQQEVSTDSNQNLKDNHLDSNESIKQKSHEEIHDNLNIHSENIQEEKQEKLEINEPIKHEDYAKDNQQINEEKQQKINQKTEKKEDDQSQNLNTSRPKKSFEIIQQKKEPLSNFISAEQIKNNVQIIHTKDKKEAESRAALWNKINESSIPPAAVKNSAWTHPILQKIYKTSDYDENMLDSDMREAMFNIFNKTGVVITHDIALRDLIKTNPLFKKSYVDIEVFLDIRKKEFSTASVKNGFNPYGLLSNNHEQVFPQTVKLAKALTFLETVRPDVDNVSFLKNKEKFINTLAGAFDSPAFKCREKDALLRQINQGRANVSSEKISEADKAHLQDVKEALDARMPKDLVQAKKSAAAELMKYINSRGVINQRGEFKASWFTKLTKRLDITQNKINKVRDAIETIENAASFEEIRIGIETLKADNTKLSGDVMTQGVQKAIKRAESEIGKIKNIKLSTEEVTPAPSKVDVKQEKENSTAVAEPKKRLIALREELIDKFTKYIDSRAVKSNEQLFDNANLTDEELIEKFRDMHLANFLIQEIANKGRSIKGLSDIFRINRAKWEEEPAWYYEGTPLDDFKKILDECEFLVNPLKKIREKIVAELNEYIESRAVKPDEESSYSFEDLTEKFRDVHLAHRLIEKIEVQGRSLDELQKIMITTRDEWAKEPFLNQNGRYTQNLKKILENGADMVATSLTNLASLTGQAEAEDKHPVKEQREAAAEQSQRQLKVEVEEQPKQPEVEKQQKQVETKKQRKRFVEEEQHSSPEELEQWAKIYEKFGMGKKTHQEEKTSHQIMTEHYKKGIRPGDDDFLSDASTAPSSRHDLDDEEENKDQNKGLDNKGSPGHKI